MKRPTTWNDPATDQRLRDLAEDMGATSVGRQMGLSRNQVLSRASRLGVTFNPEIDRSNMPDSFWTSARVMVLRKGAADGLTIVATAKQLGVSTATVRGKARRLGVEFIGRRYTYREGAAPKPKAPKAMGGFNIKGGTPTPPAPLILVKDEPGTETVVSIGAHMCRWPIGDVGEPDFSLCGKPKTRGSFCEVHAARGYVAAPPRKPKTEPTGRRFA